MSSKVYQFEVEQIPPVDSLSEFTKLEKVQYGIITRTGIQNAYRVAFAKGQGASRKDSTFDKTKGIHTCCGSRVAWRHKVDCDLLKWDDEL